ncbi:DUF488 domain-containing protein [Salinisphaera sp.]|uniref:DUF488 domain-containing protein n=1 Tax=Salinisphaera sp. TaxID=1914330 RepID=UPI000C4FC4B2|nr:DUF488 domain-containing protein [Salinisphaera sp.]MAS10356.1 hypothetical protein [Salinisphaera sp.]|tara:strand:+ start:416 stop:769 length:354 start_codon:yes stop_codon:yes gene_type:complete
MHIATRRIYDPACDDDGYRALVDRIWPRGVSKRDAALDGWYRSLAPSTELRRWFGHDPARWDRFCARYRAELDEAEADVIDELRARAAETGLMLLYAARDTEHNNAVVLKRYLEDRA